MSRFDAAAALEPLKDFQRATAEHVYQRLYAEEDPVRRGLRRSLLMTVLWLA